MIVATTKTMVLRRFGRSDAPAFVRLLADPQVMRFSRNGAISRDHAIRWFEGILADYERFGYSLWAVEALRDQQVMGYCGIMHHELQGAREYEVGYRLMPQWWGRGYATEAAAAARDAAFAQIDTPYLISLIDPDNIASRRVAEKIGMTHWLDTDWHGTAVRVYRCTRPSTT